MTLRQTQGRLKEELRRKMRSRLNKLKDGHVESIEACAFLLSLDEVKKARTLLVYVSQEGELSTHELIQWLLVQPEQRVCVPAFEEKRQRYVASWLRDFSRDLEVGKYGILEPKAEAKRLVDWADIEVAIIPALAFDKRGHRLGRGGGYFDRILTKIAGKKIGLVFDCQIVESVPTEQHDIPVDIVVTEERVIYCKR